jgi:hypothetical protein
MYINDPAGESFRQEQGRSAVVASKRRFPMKLASAAAAFTAIALFVIPVAYLAQSSGGSSAGSSSGSAAGSPSAGSAGAGSQSISGVPSGPAAPGGLDNAGEDPNGAGKASREASPSPGTNSSGTAQSSGAGANTGSGVTTGSGRSTRSGADMTGPQRSGEAAIGEKNKEVDRKIKSICRGC